MKRTLIISLAFLMIFAFLFISANANEQCSSVLEQCVFKWESIKDYQCKMQAYNKKGEEEDYREYEYKFMKPNYVYMMVTKGKSKKAKVYYDPTTNKVKGCKHTFFGVHLYEL